ncbi:MAG TPA: hypothetical protein VNH39_14275, partial [Steroidobacteraceae bacterium]|nr:hypothetical protein [Steroidobacteraceae bacterium]
AAESKKADSKKQCAHFDRGPAPKNKIVHSSLLTFWMAPRFTRRKPGRPLSVVIISIAQRVGRIVTDLCGQNFPRKNRIRLFSPARYTL